MMKVMIIKLTKEIKVYFVAYKFFLLIYNNKYNFID